MSSQMICPRCSAVLQIGNRNGIEIDYCTTCNGIWLDGGELEKIIERQSGNRAADQQSQQTQQPQNYNNDEPRESWLERIMDIFD